MRRAGLVLAMGDSSAEMRRGPVDDDPGEQFEAGYPVMPTFGCPAADLAAAADIQGALQGGMRPALIEPIRRSRWRIGIQQLLNDEERPFGPSDFRDTTARPCAADRRRTSAKLTWWQDARPPVASLRRISHHLLVTVP